MQTQTLLLKNMDCDACTRLVAMTLQEIPGVQKVLANIRDVEVVFDETKTSIDALNKALESIGHAAIEG